MDSTECARIIKNIRTNFYEYMTKAKLQSIIIGISGGIDSAICAALLKPVCDTLSIPLIGVSLPSDSNKKDEIDRADLIGDAFCTKYAVQPIVGHADEMYDSIGMITEEIEYNWDKLSDRQFKINLGNIKARIRMIHLYSLAYLYKGLVISTDNLTEYYLGFWTLHGDVGDYAPIQNLWKTEVYDVSKHLAIAFSMAGNDDEARALMECVQAVPTDGLGITSSDLEQIGASSYEEVDKCLNSIINHYACEFSPDVMKKIEDRHKSTHFKRTNPYNISREDLFK